METIAQRMRLVRLIWRILLTNLLLKRLEAQLRLSYLSLVPPVVLEVSSFSITQGDSLLVLIPCCSMGAHCYQGLELVSSLMD